MDEYMKVFGVAIKAYIFKKNRILVIYKTAKEAANDPKPENRKDVPGGRLEFGEEPIQALKREVKEEVNLKVNVVKPLRIWHYVKGNFQLVGINYLCLWEAGDVLLSDEHEYYEWLTKEDIISLNWDDVDQYLEAFNNYEKDYS